MLIKYVHSYINVQVTSVLHVKYIINIVYAKPLMIIYEHTAHTIKYAP